jgi:hypothetical protein
MKRCIIDSFKKLDEDFLNEAKNKYVLGKPLSFISSISQVIYVLLFSQFRPYGPNGNPRNL